MIDWQEYFGYGNVFVLWLKDDRRITKHVLKYGPDPQKYVTCHSYNPEAANEKLPESMIKQVWKVVNVLINKGWGDDICPKNHNRLNLSRETIIL